MNETEAIKKNIMDFSRTREKTLRRCSGGSQKDHVTVCKKRYGTVESWSQKDMEVLASSLKF
jgi:hypothetical protein